MTYILWSLTIAVAAIGWPGGAAAKTRSGGAGEPADFISAARQFETLVTCAGDRGELPPSTAKVVASHCRKLERRIGKFRSRYVERASSFFSGVRPADLPKTVVYPFGGGDLVSALITYPHAHEFTTISLEHGGDPRGLTGLSVDELEEQLALFRDTVDGLLRNNDSASARMRQMEASAIPGQLSFFLLGLAILDYEPVALRYFRLDSQGRVQYLTNEQIAAMDGSRAQRMSLSWTPGYSPAFSNLELSFRRRGADSDEPVRVHRHFAANLANQHFANSPLQRHLLAKGPVAAMTKAASYLLWSTRFSKIRDYLTGNMTLLISDSTGVPPKYASRAGFEQITYGVYTGPFLDAAEVHNQAFIELWANQKKRRLPFRFGYPDAAGNVHLLITRPAGGQ